MPSTDDLYDFLIIGAGCAGYSAGIYAARFGLKTILLSKDKGGLITTTHVVENWPGIISITGQGLADRLAEHLAAYPVPVVVDEVDAVSKDKDGIFSVKTLEGAYRARTVLLATGSAHKKLGVPGEKELANKGVSYCAICDGPLFKNKVVAVVGGSDSAAKEALLLSEHASKVYLVYRGERIHPEPINFDRVMANPKIEVVNNTNVAEIRGGKSVTGVVLDAPHRGSKELALQGVFIAIGQVPQSTFAADLGAKLNAKGEIVIDRHSRTSVEGLYAAGDVADLEFKQAITGAAEAVTAAWAAFEHLGKRKAKKG